MIINFDAVVLVITGLLGLSFTYFVFTRYEKSLAIYTFGLTTLSISGWVLTNALAEVFTPHAPVLDFFGRATFVFAAFIFTFLYLYVILFPYPVIRVGTRFIIQLLVAPTLLATMLYGSRSIIKSFEQDSRLQTVIGDAFWIYAVYIFLMLVLVLYEMVQKYKRADGIHRWQLKWFILAITVSCSVGLIFNLILPFFVTYYIADWIGPSSAIIWLGFCLYIIKKK